MKPCRSTMKMLSEVRKVGSAMANTDIRTIRKISGAKRARKLMGSNLAGAGASMRVASVISVSSRGLAAQRHHRHQLLFAGVGAHRLAGHPALAHGDDAVADRQHFGQL